MFFLRDRGSVFERQCAVFCLRDRQCAVVCLRDRGSVLCSF